MKISLIIKTHTTPQSKIAEIVAEEIIINTVEEGLDLLGNLYYQDFDKLILHQNNITPVFFNLSNGMAGEILQKFSNYRVRLAIVGEFSQYPSKSLHDFILESNQKGQVNFVGSVEEAIKVLE